MYSHKVLPIFHLQISTCGRRFGTGFTRRNLTMACAGNKQYQLSDSNFTKHLLTSYSPWNTLGIAKISGKVDVKVSTGTETTCNGVVNNVQAPTASVGEHNPYLSLLQSEVDSTQDNTAVTDSVETILQIEPSESHGILRGMMESLQPYLTREFFPVDCTARFIEFMHDSTGLPWWGSILVVAVMVKTSLFPLSVMSMKAQHKLQKHLPELDSELMTLKAQCRQARMRGQFKSDREERRHFRINHDAMRQEIYEKHKCHPLLSLIAVIVQAPVFLFVSLGIRNAMGFVPLDGFFKSSGGNESFVTEGLFWCSNFLVSDPYYILPLCIFIATCINTELSYLKVLPNEQSFKITCFFWFLRVAGIWITFLSSIVPSGVAYYWFLSNTLGLIQNCILMTPKAQAMLGIPHVKGEVTGFQSVKAMAKHKYLGAPLTYHDESLIPKMPGYRLEQKIIKRR